MPYSLLLWSGVGRKWWRWVVCSDQEEYFIIELPMHCDNKHRFLLSSLTVLQFYRYSAKSYPLHVGQKTPTVSAHNPFTSLPLLPCFLFSLQNQTSWEYFQCSMYLLPHRDHTMLRNSLFPVTKNWIISKSSWYFIVFMLYILSGIFSSL